MTALDEKVEELESRYKSDFQVGLLPLVANPDVVEQYVDNYRAEYLRYRNYLDSVTL